MGFFDSIKQAAQPQPQNLHPSIEKAYSEVTADCKVAFFLPLGLLKEELGKKLLPGEEVLFMDGTKGGALAVTNKRVVWQSSMGMKSSALPVSDSLQAVIEMKASGTRARFTADGGRELVVKGMVLSARRIEALKAALPVGTTF